MVKLKWDGYYFHNGLDALEICFGSTRNALAHDIIQAKKEIALYKDYLDQGGEWIGEVDEEGDTLWDQERVLEIRTESIQDALMILRKSFAISIYHHWERSALEWAEKKQIKHDDLEDLVRHLGHPIDPKLAAVRDLANLLKHNNNKWHEKLDKSWKKLIIKDWQASSRLDWCGTICLEDEDIFQIIRIVRSSGPISRSIIA